METTIRVHAIDVECEPGEVLSQVDALAEVIASDAAWGLGFRSTG
jgi:hypothetical protein